MPPTTTPPSALTIKTQEVDSGTGYDIDYKEQTGLLPATAGTLTSSSATPTSK
jgi:hypothetical protein